MHGQMCKGLQSRSLNIPSWHSPLFYVARQTFKVKKSAAHKMILQSSRNLISRIYLAAVQLQQQQHAE
jgi:hypothetical protein